MRKHLLRIPALILALILCLTLFSACQKAPQEEIDTSETVVDPIPEPEPEPEPVFYSYLNGLPVDEVTSTRRPVAIMINNIKQALPQLGISKAGIIYEALAEGGITRMLAVFDQYEDIPQIGSIRSARPYYLDLAQGLDAIFFHIGGSPAAYSALSSRTIDSVDFISGSNSSACWRDAERKKNNGYEHSVLTSGERITKKIASAGFRNTRNDAYTEAFHFADNVSLDAGVPATKASVTFSNYKTGVFSYDAENDFYRVSQHGKAHIDAGVGAQLAVKNVFVLYINSYPVKGDDKGRLAFDIVGSGKGKYITGGKAVDINWKKESPTHSFYYTNTDGTEVEVARGDSYVCIVPLNASVTLE